MGGMTNAHVLRKSLFTVCLALVAPLAAAQATATQQPPATQKPYEPLVGQAGKDVVWVPTPQGLVDKMLDIASVTASDYVIDLGSGDGRTVITAAKRGATAMGIEYDPNMVELSQHAANLAGVAGKATFVKADLFETDFSKATVITMFLLPNINLKLRPKILDLKPGTRIVSNSFTMGEWDADDTATVTEDCVSWCTALLWIVPAKVEGTWKLGQAELTLAQQFQNVTGVLGGTAIGQGRLHGDAITFQVGDRQYEGRVSGGSMQGVITKTGEKWTATRK